MKMKNWMRSAGFTLVELIVVIAVLGILGAGAAVGYSGYVKKANKAADEALVAQVKYALEVAYVADPSYSGATAVVLSKDAAATVSPDSGAATDWVNKAMTDAFGANWANELKLQYDGWANGVAASQEMLRIFGDISADSPMYSVVNGTADITFADKIDELFGKVEDVSKYVADKVADKSGFEDLNNGAKLVTAAADATLSQNWDGTSAGAESFAKMWCLGGFEVQVGAGDTITGAASTAMASAAAIRARNECIANYVSSDFPELYTLIAEYSQTTGTGKITDNIPDDFYMKFVSESDSALESKIKDLFSDSMTDDEKNQQVASLKGKIQEYCGFKVNDGNLDVTSGKMYQDALAYYTMMHTVSKLDKNADGSSKGNLNDETYWDEVGTAVRLYGAVARGEVDLASLNVSLSGLTGENTIVILPMGADGLLVQVTPKAVLAE